MARPKFQRILIKASGEALMGARAFGIDNDVVKRIAGEIKATVALGVTLGLVIGGGNIFRGLALEQGGGDRVTGDHMGMLATVINALSMSMALRACGIDVRVMSNLELPAVCETFRPPNARAHLEAGRVVIFAGGTGNPYFTTDSAAVLKAAELEFDAVFKATKVDGVYSADPLREPHATRYDHLSYDDVLEKNLRVMDMTAIAFARDNRIPLVVFSLLESGAIPAVAAGNGKYTLIT